MATKGKFEIAVEKTPDIAAKYKEGLKALKKEYSKKIIVKNTRLLDGSVDIDETVKDKYPNENRWDYVFAYKDETYFVEFHTAKTDEVKCVINKLKWLKGWLQNNAPELSKIKSEKPYYWIQSRDFRITKDSPQYRQLSQLNLMPTKELKLE